MRKLIPSGTCSTCGQAGPVWTNHVKVLDLGAVVLEPDTTQPDRCDECETRHRVERDYCEDPAWARLVWCAETAEAALRLLGLG